MKSSLRVKLKYIDEWNSRRAIIARLYLSTNNSHGYELILPMTGKGNVHIWHLFTLKLNRHDELNLYLNKKGSGTLIHYPIPPYRQTAYKELNHLKDNYPISNAIADQILSLPIGPHLAEDQADYVCKAVNTFFKK